MRISIAPGFAALTIGEVCIGSTNSEVNSEIELAVEWSTVWFTYPRIICSRRKLTLLKETLSEGH